MGYHIDQSGNYYEGDRQGADMEVPQRPSAAYIWNEGAWALRQPTREEQIAAIEATRDAACVAPVTALDRSWQADARSQQLLNSAITLAQAGLPLPTVWRDADNGDMPVAGIADLLAISGAIAAQVQAAYAASWAAKAALP